MFAFGIQPGHCYYGRCCDGEFVILVKEVTESGCTGEKPSWECTGNLVYLNGHTITDNFPSTVFDYMSIVEISAEDFRRIYTEYSSAQLKIRNIMHEARGRITCDQHGEG